MSCPELQVEMLPAIIILIIITIILIITIIINIIIINMQTGLSAPLSKNKWALLALGNGQGFLGF